ncbi:hypothetical protein TYRP_017686 [Tyrophagus putrescentiae]|nr:hypothetical protein TYRP_017686 [Tyrophagus putrescentiae]
MEVKLLINVGSLFNQTSKHGHIALHCGQVQLSSAAHQEQVKLGAAGQQKAHHIGEAVLEGVVQRSHRLSQRVRLVDRGACLQQRPQHRRLVVGDCVVKRSLVLGRRLGGHIGATGQQKAHQDGVLPLDCQVEGGIAALPGHIHQKRFALPVLLLQQPLDDCRPAVGHRQMKCRPAAVTGLVDDGVLGGAEFCAEKQLHDGLVAAHRRQVQRTEAMVVLQRDVRLREAEQGVHHQGVLAEHCRVQGRVRLVAEHVGVHQPLGDGALHKVDGALPGGVVQRRVTVPVKLVRPCAVLHQVAHQVEVARGGGDVQRGASLLEDRINVGAVPDVWLNLLDGVLRRLLGNVEHVSVNVHEGGGIGGGDNGHQFWIVVRRFEVHEKSEAQLVILFVMP